MARNGSGTYTAPANSVNPAVGGTTIDATDFNALVDDLETALSDSIARNGETSTTAVIPFASGIKADTVAENSSNTGVTVDGVLLKDGAIIVNETGADVDSRIEGDTDANLVYVDAGNDRVGIGTATPGTKLDVNGTLTATDAQLTTITITSTDAGAALGPTLDLHRNSASPAASDIISGVRLMGEDSAGNAETYAQIKGTILDPTTTSEDGDIRFDTVVGGTLTNMAIFGQGIYMPAATGGDPGGGGINATNLEIQGVSIGVASQATQETGTAVTVGDLVTSGRQHFHDSALKVHGTITWTTGTPAAGANAYNIASVDDTGVGIATVNYTTAFSDADYAALCQLSDTADISVEALAYTDNRAAGSVQVVVGTSATPADTHPVSIMCAGDL